MSHKIAYVFQKDPSTHVLANQGVAKVFDAEEATLRYELETFVCDGEYERGMARILDAYLANFDKAEQPGVWVSGFFGSGKSHLVKVLRYLWVDHHLSDGTSARSLVTLPQSIQDQFVELSNLGKRHGGLHAISGLIDSSEAPTLRRAVMSLVFKSVGLPSGWNAAQCCIWLKQEGWYDAVVEHVKSAGKDFANELRNMFVSTPLAEAILAASSGYADSTKEVRAQLKAQFKTSDDPTNKEMIDAIRQTLGDKKGQIPCTLFVIDELQQTIGEHDAGRTYEVQTIVEALCSAFGGRLLVVGTGQSALTGVSNLQKLQGRFPVGVQLSATDVNSVIRQTILKKRDDRTRELHDILTSCSGEIDRHLRSTKLEPKPEDKAELVADYPVLPTRRRFWAAALRAIDKGGIAGQLRNQLRVVHEAVKAMAHQPLGHVISGHVVYEQISTDMVQAGIIQPEIDLMIREQHDGTRDGEIRGGLCALIYLVGKMPREGASDDGMRATTEILSDLLVIDLKAGSSALRARIPKLLDELVTNGTLMRIEDEYRIQTPEGSAWEGDFQDRLHKINGDPARMAGLRNQLLQEAAAAKPLPPTA